MKRKQLLTNLSKALVRRRESLRRVLAQQGQLATQERTVGDSVDAAVDSAQGELDAQLAAAESRELAAIEAALDRFRQGDYGLCEACGKPIPAARLTALPFAKLCINCQRADERLPTMPEATAPNKRLAALGLWRDENSANQTVSN